MGMYKPAWSGNPGLSSVSKRRIYFDNVEVKRITAEEVLDEK